MGGYHAGRDVFDLGTHPRIPTNLINNGRKNARPSIGLH